MIYSQIYICVFYEFNIKKKKKTTYNCAFKTSVWNILLVTNQVRVCVSPRLIDFAPSDSKIVNYFRFSSASLLRVSDYKRYEIDIVLYDHHDDHVWQSCNDDAAWLLNAKTTA